MAEYAGALKYTFTFPLTQLLRKVLCCDDRDDKGESISENKWKYGNKACNTFKVQREVASPESVLSISSYFWSVSTFAAASSDELG